VKPGTTAEESTKKSGTWRAPARETQNQAHGTEELGGAQNKSKTLRSAAGNRSRETKKMKLNTETNQRPNRKTDLSTPNQTREK
jgi:hypothetical protein